MTSWECSVGDILRISHNGKEVRGRLAGFADSLDNTTPLVVNLRVPSGVRWSRIETTIQAGQVIGLEDQPTYPILKPIANGRWSAHGNGWAVHGDTREAAVAAYETAERRHQEIWTQAEE